TTTDNSLTLNNITAIDLLSSSSSPPAPADNKKKPSSSPTPAATLQVSFSQAPEPTTTFLTRLENRWHETYEALNHAERTLHRWSHV
ncbi:hypothetical protein BGZ95_005040, partial [Linnemannia exigua]